MFQKVSLSDGENTGSTGDAHEVINPNFHAQKHEILEESTVNDRQIIRRLARNAQQWERLRTLHRDHLQGLSGLETLSTEGRWFAGSDDESGTAIYSSILEVVKNLEDVGEGIEYLIRETNSLIQTVSGETALDFVWIFGNIPSDVEFNYY